MTLIKETDNFMNNKTIHGKIFKSIREERGIKLKDAAGSAISARTLIRFEADETSPPITTFENNSSKLLFLIISLIIIFYHSLHTI